jgi:hypothetical protein
MLGCGSPLAEHLHYHQLATAWKTVLSIPILVPYPSREQRCIDVYKQEKRSAHQGLRDISIDNGDPSLLGVLGHAVKNFLDTWT